MATEIDEDERRARARARRHEIEEEALYEVIQADNEEEGEEEEEEEGSEWETDTDESDYDHQPAQLMKPVFVRKEERETIQEIERLKQEEERLLAEKEKKLIQRKEESRSMLLQSIQREEAELAKGDADSDAEGPPDTDGDDTVEFQKWKVRELRRIKRDQEEREAMEKERRETERRRKLTDAERMEEDRKLGKLDQKEKAKWNFLQRYYHKGAFYLDDETIAKARQVEDAPTLDDRFDKTNMPKIMQVKKFGLASQTKWTHLTNEDTSRKEMPIIPITDPIHNRIQKRLGGTGTDLERPSRKRTKL